jgi:hypothetical protein
VKEKPKNEQGVGGEVTRLRFLSIFCIFLVICTFAIYLLFSPEAPTELSNFGVDAAQGWQPTGLRLEAGQRFTIEYLTGDWSIFPGDSFRYTADGGASACGNPDCVEPLPNYTKSGLIGRIGDAPAFPVGSYLESTAPSGGMLQLRINDAGTHDNEGLIHVRITSP